MYVPGRKILATPYRLDNVNFLTVYQGHVRVIDVQVATHHQDSASEPFLLDVPELGREFITPAIAYQAQQITQLRARGQLDLKTVALRAILEGPKEPEPNNNHHLTPVLLPRGQSGTNG
jgi:hypothetical protein